MKEFQKYEMLDCGITTIGHKFSMFEQGVQGHIVDRLYTAVRAGIAFAADKSPFHVAVVGQQYIDSGLYADTIPGFELLYEATDHGLDLEARHNRLADVADLYKCNFYADLSGINDDAAESYRHFKSKCHYEFGNLLEAPYSQNFRIGIELIKSQVKSHYLDISKDSPAFGQLSRITEADLAEPDVRQKFFAVEALRHVMAAFKREPGGRKVLILPRPQLREYSWMN